MSFEVVPRSVRVCAGQTRTLERVDGDVCYEPSPIDENVKKTLVDAGALLFKNSENCVHTCVAQSTIPEANNGLFYVGEPVLQPTDIISLYPCCGMEKEVFHALDIRSDVRTFWESYAITIAVKRSNNDLKDVVALPIDPSVVINDTTIVQALNQKEAMLASKILVAKHELHAVVADEDMNKKEYFCNAHYANEPPSGISPNATMCGVQRVQDDVYEQTFLTNMYVALVATTKIETFTEVFWCYGSAYNYERGYEAPNCCRNLGEPEVSEQAPKHLSLAPPQQTAPPL